MEFGYPRGGRQISVLIYICKGVRWNARSREEATKSAGFTNII
jgi:hypothetical protein